MKCECCMDCYKIDCCDDRCDFKCSKCNMNKNNILKEQYKMKILRVCSNCKHSIQLGYKEYHCLILDYEVNWCGTCKNHELLDVESKDNGSNKYK